MSSIGGTTLKKWMLVMLAILGSQPGQIYALRCYACSVTPNSGDKNCVDDPKSVIGQAIVNCNRKYCVIQRQELLDPPGKLNTFLRGCDDDPPFLNDVVEDSTFRTYFRSCSDDLCNVGDGLDTANGLSGIEAGAAENLLVPGLEGSGSKTAMSGTVGSLVFIASLLCYYRTN
ncbi:uncharacterized protein LOC129750550 [Uranotaenia lowii]|uniref:uncharacterized protein LOC129750550 n=1 Tax=Uranotaenia lowii TaxID=190385 RepID=UPI00247AD164|nr:uncharacterized protein LOC129750550 [Uranotaenia lowii]XP_055601493.1 uncharacterized protein LOC129750550 [Uranotaenia lowii]XP_055601494.1 uncharacterized protein LOC129750550 [Uranotaenia lowii]XP_055601495.1 uncharacterized protein LOC129750550 [Uranotaenia lowii]